MHGMGTFHGKASFYQCSFALPVQMLICYTTLKGPLMIYRNDNTPCAYDQFCFVTVAPCTGWTDVLITKNHSREDLVIYSISLQQQGYIIYDLVMHGQISSM